MSNLREALIASFAAGTLLETINSIDLGRSDERQALAENLAMLHNEGLIDVVATFSSLKNRTDQRVDFFRIRSLFEEMLPEIDAPVVDVMRCVYSLYQEAGEDLAAGAILEPFVAFCSKNTERPKQGLKAIEDNGAPLDLLTPVLVAGSRLDPDYFLATAIQFAQNDNGEVRKQAAFALGSLERLDATELLDAALAALEGIISREENDEILGCAVRSLSRLMRSDATNHERVRTLLHRALTKGGDHSLHAASGWFGFDTRSLPPDLLDILIAHLLRFNPENAGTVKNIDFGIRHLLEMGNQRKGLDFLEELLLSNPQTLSGKIFDGATTVILQNNTLRNRVVTRWLLHAEPVLCEAVHSMIGDARGIPIDLEADPSEFETPDMAHIVFVARKAIGYLFFQPISATSFVISLMGLTPHDETLAALGELLFEPLLLNYTGDLLEYVKRRATVESERVANTLNAAILKTEEYLDDLRSVGTIRELRPGTAQREAHYRYQSHQLAEVYREVEKKSVLLSVVPKSALLYGRKSIAYVYGPDGKANRIEMALRRHTTELDVPRGEQIDPFGLDHMLRVFRAEQLRT